VVTAAELRELDDEELDGRLSEYRRELLNLRFQLATGQLDNAARLGQVRKDVARVLTVLRDREIALAEGRPVAPEPLAPSPARRARARRGAVEEAPAIEEEVLPEEAPVAGEAPVEEEVLPEEISTAAEEPEEAREAKRPALRRRRGRAAKAEAAGEAEGSAEEAAEEDE
jgi:large subunit ribosomal protein L29